MDEDKKKPAGAGGKGRGPKKPSAPRGGDKKPFQRQDGAKRAYANRDGGAPGKPRPGKRERAEERAGEERRPRKPYAARTDDGARPERPRFEKRDGDARPFRKPEGDRPFRKPAGAARTGEGEERRPRKPHAARTDDGARSERPRFEKRDGDARPFRKPDGDRPFRKQDGPKRPYASRDGAPGKPRPERRGPDETGRAGEEAGGGGERIAKRLARAGVASRRDAEDLIAAGRVTVNGKVLDTPAINVGPRDRIALDGTEIPAIERTRLFLFHKPAGVVTTNRDPEGRRTVFDVLPEGLPRLMTVGRLDINTEGLLLLTNDGGLSRVLELPATGWLRRYRVRVHGKVDADALAGLKDGIAVDGVFYGAVEATLDREQGSNAWLTIGLREGKNREVRNILGALGLEVTRLIRVSYGPFQLGELGEGELRELKGRLLRDQLGERLIAEAGANFDAPVVTQFSSKPEARQDRKREPAGERPNRKRDREQKREDALDRLHTKPSRGARPQAGDRKGGKPPVGERKGTKQAGTRDERTDERPRARTSNVWMAPGARPVGEKKAAALAERGEGRRYAGKPRPAGVKKGGKPGGAPGKAPPKGPRGPRGAR